MPTFGYPVTPDVEAQFIIMYGLCLALAFAAYLSRRINSNYRDALERIRSLDLR